MVATATLRACAALLIAVLASIITACPGAAPEQADMTVEELQLLRGAQLIADALRACQRDTAELPAALRDAEPYLLRGEKWPLNPYTQQPLEQTDSAQFDPTASVGRIFYEKFARDGVVVNFRLHVFGKAGELAMLDNTPGSLR